MRPKALVVEDDPLIMPVIEAALSSLQHKHLWVTNQQDAREAVQREAFDYVLLDLQIPAVPDSTVAETVYGLYLLRDIRKIKSQEEMPVIVMTGYWAQCLDMTSDLIKAGADDFISKPFNNRGRTLTQLIEKTLANRGTGKRRRGKKHTGPLERFQGGTLEFFPDRAELLGVRIITDRGTGQCLQVLRELARQDAAGRYVRLSAEDLARLIDAPSTATITACVQTLRRNMQRYLERELALEVLPTDVIAHSEQGYFVREWIETVGNEGFVASNNAAAACGSSDSSVADRWDVELGIPLNERQTWILAELRRGVRLTRTMVERRFDVAAKTAKRDLAELTTRNVVKYVRKGRGGYYRLEESVSLATAD